MKILLTGGTQEAFILLRAVANAKDHKITHCSDGARAIVELLRNGYDWAIIDGRAVSGGEKEFVRIVRAMGSSDLSTLNGDVPPAHCPEPSNDSSCGVRWSKDGVLELHCALHNEQRQSGRICNTSKSILEKSGYTIFEYHAPCVKKRAV